jgi:hypothetical protein
MLRNTREDRMTTKSSTNAAGLRGETATLPTIGELPERFLAPGGRGRRGRAPGVLDLTAGALEWLRGGKLVALTSFGCWGRKGVRGSDLEIRQGGGRDGLERGLGFSGCPRVGDKEEEAHASCVDAQVTGASTRLSCSISEL